MMRMDKKVNWFSSVLRPLASCFNVSSEGENMKSSNVPVPSGPEATMVAAAKHFSSAHKVRLGENVKPSKAAGSSGPEATMVAAAKHFSSAHKVRLD
ncbi:hypothetical protein F0562_033037 [Nyssa sinensis]|uniref:Uncharacterized protein n=1 Tax=Nyssa sinensis TaxID=561372 RepID=A0A5J5ASN5_9ASTE|nr:hypothetical protein F0562_033037 [Nyssa sinensis]